MISVLLSNLRGDGIFEPFPVDGDKHDSANEEMTDMESEDESDEESDKESNKKPVNWNVLKKKFGVEITESDQHHVRQEHINPFHPFFVVCKHINDILPFHGTVKPVCELAFRVDEI
jgi:hypothetical protein